MTYLPRNVKITINSNSNNGMLPIKSQTIEVVFLFVIVFYFI